MPVLNTCVSLSNSNLLARAYEPRRPTTADMLGDNDFSGVPCEGREDAKARLRDLLWSMIGARNNDHARQSDEVQGCHIAWSSGEGHRPTTLAACDGFDQGRCLWVVAYECHVRAATVRAPWPKCLVIDRKSVPSIQGRQFRSNKVKRCFAVVPGKKHLRPHAQLENRVW